MRRLLARVLSVAVFFALFIRPVYAITAPTMPTGDVTEPLVLEYTQADDLSNISGASCESTPYWQGIVYDASNAILAKTSLFPLTTTSNSAWSVVSSGQATRIEINYSDTGETFADGTLTTTCASYSTTVNFALHKASSGSSSSSTPTPGPTIITRILTPTPTPTPIPDKTPPTVALSTDFSKPFTVAPTIHGTASDPSGVTAISYSLDDGKSWTPVDTHTGTAFSFTPSNLLDDNYLVRIRATDGKGNTGITTTVWTMVIDRLPPALGIQLLTLGPQVVDESVVGLHPRFTVSAVGGPTQVQLIKNGTVFATLQKNPDTGLWYGDLVFDAPGMYSLTSHAIDGAGNTEDKALPPFVVRAPGTVVDLQGKPIIGARIDVYVRNTQTNTFAKWDGAAYGLRMPVKTASDGSYALYLPKGTYYLRIAKAGYQPFVSDIFSVVDPFPLTQAFTLRPARTLRIGQFVIPIPDFRQTHGVVSVPLGKEMVKDAGHPFIGKEMVIPGTPVRGLPAVVTVLPTWDPQSATQLGALNQVAKNSDIRVIALVPHESTSSVSIFSKRAGYMFSVVADPDGALFSRLSVSTSPTHMFVDRRGIVRTVVRGVLSKEEIVRLLVQ